MSRKKIISRRKISPDHKFGSEILAKFINMVMVHGKKSIAASIVYDALNIVSKKRKKIHLKVFEKALDNVKPIVEVKSRRVGGSTYQVPVEIRSSRSNTLAMRWIIESARKRKDKSMSIRLANELNESYDNKGMAVRKKENVHKIAEANKAFSHYRW
ncbi:30S ribosomal protein S7 [Candidatus Riesia sp. GBBU]|nr:30S ribosomal protein S7 [Candidatus Riesia sp. GBBU]